MTPSTGKQQGRDARDIEVALVFPVARFFVLLILVGGLVGFRYDDLAQWARRGTPSASRHGKQYGKESGIRRLWPGLFSATPSH